MIHNKLVQNLVLKTIMGKISENKVGKILFSSTTSFCVDVEINSDISCQVKGICLEPFKKLQVLHVILQANSQSDLVRPQAVGLSESQLQKISTELEILRKKRQVKSNRDTNARSKKEQSLSEEFFAKSLLAKKEAPKRPKSIR